MVDEGLAQAQNKAATPREVAPWEWPDRRRLVITYVAIFFWFLSWFIVTNVNSSDCSFAVFFKEHTWAMNTYHLVMFLVAATIYSIGHGKQREIRIGGKLKTLLRWASAMICLFCCETSSDWWSAAVGVSMALFALLSCMLLGITDTFNCYETFIGMSIQAALTEMTKKMGGWEYLIIAVYTFFMLFAKYFANLGYARMLAAASDVVPR